jgi:hypothetical protein
MSIESRNVDIEPINCAYAVLTEHISEFMRLKLEEKGIDGFIDCRAFIKYDPKGKTDEEKHQMHVVAFFNTSSKDINSMGSQKNAGNNPFLDKMDKGGSISPSNNLRAALSPFANDDRLYVNRDDSSTYSVDLNVYRVFGMMFDADYRREEIVVVKYDKISDINYKFTIIKQAVNNRSSGGHKDILSMKAERRFADNRR